MKAPRVLFTSVASLLLTLPAFAVTDTWDGGDINDILTFPQNWVDDTAPASDLANTDLIFAGAIRPTPTLNAPFSAHGITFDNTASAFTILGDQLNVGSGGITNNDTQTMSFANVVNFGSVAVSGVNAASGGLTFADAIGLPTGFLIVDGAGATSFQDIVGTSTASLGKFGVGAMTWNPAGPVPFDIDVQEGTLTIGGDDTVNLLTSTASIDVTGTSVLNINDSLSLNGAQITRTGNAAINLAAGRTLNVFNGADVDIAGSFGVNGSTILVTDAGSTFDADGFTVSGGGFLSVSGGADVSVSVAFALGAAGNGTAVVDGIGSSLGGGGHLFMGQNPGNVASLTFSNGSTGTFGAMDLAFTTFPLTSATLRIQSGAAVTGATLDAANLNSQSTAEITIAGAGSSLTLTGQAMFGGGGAATLRVEDGADFHSGTGVTLVSGSSAITITGGNYHSHGNLTISGGGLTRDASGQFLLDAATTFSVTSGADAVFTGSYANTTASTIRVAGSGSTLSTTNALSINGGSTLNVEAGGAVSAGDTLNVGTIGNGTVSVTGGGSTLSGNLLSVGLNGATGSLTFSDTSTGTFGAIEVDNSSEVGTTGSLIIQGGATVTGTGLIIADNAFANMGTVTITGAGSALTLTGAATATIGATSSSIATLTVENGGTFTTGTGLTTVNATGDLNINAGGTMIVRGDMIVANSLDIASGGTVILGGGAPAPGPGEFAEAEFSAIGDGDFESWESSASAAIPEPGIGALLASALALLGARRLKERRFPNRRRAARARQPWKRRIFDCTPSGFC